jgi:hypothetical protein
MVGTLETGKTGTTFFSTKIQGMDVKLLQIISENLHYYCKKNQNMYPSMN